MNDSSLPCVSDIAIIGAGPYGLSLAAHLATTSLTFRIFGKPMQSWQEHMPRGMKLKSEGFASSLYDPASSYPLSQYCQENKLPYADVGSPVPLETFVAYGREFQRRLVPQLELTDITSLSRSATGFTLTTASGETLEARTVVLAVGIAHFTYIPPALADIPPAYISHTFDHSDLSAFNGRKVAVLGAGASAIDTAALLADAGADVTLLTRRSRIAFHTKGSEPRALLERLKYPRSGLGVGWKSWLCSNFPLLFHALPLKLRIRAVERHLGPAPGWFVREKVEGRIPAHFSAQIQTVAVENNRVNLTFTGGTLTVDHIIAGTGFRPSVSRLKFLEPSLLGAIKTVDDAPVLSRSFESSVPNLYFIGLASAFDFGPLTRFACGAEFTAKHLTKHLAP